MAAVAAVRHNRNKGQVTAHTGQHTSSSTMTLHSSFRLRRTSSENPRHSANATRRRSPPDSCRTSRWRREPSAGLRTRITCRTVRSRAVVCAQGETDKAPTGRQRGTGEF
jgi:hypothetical protein